MQEAYRPPCSEYSCCPNCQGGTLLGVPYLGTPQQGPPGRVPPAGYPPPGYPPSRVPPTRVLPSRVPPGRVPPCLDLAKYPPRYLPHGILDNVRKHYGIWVPPLGVCPMAFWVMLQSIMGYGYPPAPLGVDRLKTLPSPSFGCGR